MTSTNISIPINRKRFPVVLIVGLILLATLSYNLLYAQPIRFYLDDLLGWLFKGTFFFLLLFYTSIAMVSYIKVVFDKNAKLLITEDGLLDNTSIFSCGKILWDDVLEVNLKKGFNMQYLIVKLKEPEKFTADKNFLKRYFLQNRIKKIGTPLLIPETHLKCNIDILKEIIVEHINK